jgi:hypothetical protein
MNWPFLSPLEVSFPEGSDGVSTRARAVLENRGRFTQVLKGITFLMPSSPGGYVLKATARNGDRTSVEIGPAPEVLEVIPAGPGKSLVRVQAAVPSALAVDLRIELR